MKWSDPAKACRRVGLIEPSIPTVASKVPEGRHVGKAYFEVFVGPK
jgi:hypothetical protein